MGDNSWKYPASRTEKVGYFFSWFPPCWVKLGWGLDLLLNTTAPVGQPFPTPSLLIQGLLPFPFQTSCHDGFSLLLGARVSLFLLASPSPAHTIVRSSFIKLCIGTFWVCHLFPADTLIHTALPLIQQNGGIRLVPLLWFFPLFPSIYNVCNVDATTPLCMRHKDMRKGARWMLSLSARKAKGFPLALWCLIIKGYPVPLGFPGW